MNRTNLVLAALAAVQLCIAVGAYAWTAAAVPPPARPLIDMDWTSVERVEIREDPSKAEAGVVLQRAPGGWAVENAAGIQADAQKVEDLLRRVLDIRVREPVARLASSHAKLGLTDDGFTRELLLIADDRQTRVVLGGGRQAHARIDEDPTAWPAGGLSAWGLEPRPVDYVVSPYITVEPESVTALQIGEVQLVRDAGGAWQLDPPGDEAGVVDSLAVQNLVERLQKIELDGLPPDPRADVAGLRVAWQAGDASDYFVIGAGSGGMHPIASPSRGYAGLLEARHVEPWVQALKEYAGDP